LSQNAPANAAPPPAGYDLHMHTCWSYDGLVEPETCFERAAEIGLRCIAVTEHHVLDSQDEVAEAARRYPSVRSVPGAELSVTTSVGAVDLLCYGFRRPWPERLSRVLDAYHAWQRENGSAFCLGMQLLGYDFTLEHRRELLESYRPARTIAVQGLTRVRNGVLRDYLLARGFIARPEDYGELCRRVGKAVAMPPYPNVEEVVDAVHEAGAFVAIAHPYHYFLGCERSRMDALRHECRLDGIECAHPKVPKELTPVYRAYCVEHGLFSVAGSDSHTPDDYQSQLGRHSGQLEWLDEFLARAAG